MMSGRMARFIRRFQADEQGAILPLAGLLIIVLFTMAAIGVDLSLMSQRRQDLWNSADAAALAGASQLPDDPVEAERLARLYAENNDSDLATGLGVTFRCLVGDRNNDGQPDVADVPASCDPGPGVPVTAPPYVCDGGVCAVTCDAAVPDSKCNTIVLEADKTVPYNFAPIIGIDEGTTEVRSAACRGTCGGAASGPVDLIMVIDRTTSMSDSDLANAKAAALAVLDLFDPSLHHVGLAAINAGNPSNSCEGLFPDSGGSWLLVGLSSDYKDTLTIDIDGDGTLDLDDTSPLVDTIQCMQKKTGTDLGSPIKDEVYGQPDALGELLANGRPGVKMGIIFMSDGEAVRPAARPNHCQYAEDMASDAKAAGVEIFTIGFGIGSKDCNDDSGTYSPAPVAQLLAAMATGPSDDNCLSGSENSDGDHFFCEPASGDLTDVFVAAASQFAAGSGLVYLPPGA